MDGKCYHIYHTWILWDMVDAKIIQDIGQGADKHLPIRRRQRLLSVIPNPPGILPPIDISRDPLRLVQRCIGSVHFGTNRWIIIPSHGS